VIAVTWHELLFDPDDVHHGTLSTSSVQSRQLAYNVRDSYDHETGVSPISQGNTAFILVFGILLLDLGTHHDRAVSAHVMCVDAT
jgi:hypothetical protein